MLVRMGQKEVIELVNATPLAIGDKGECKVRGTFQTSSKRNNSTGTITKGLRQEGLGDTIER